MREVGWLRPHASKVGLFLRFSDAALIVALHYAAYLLYAGTWGYAHVAASVIAIVVFHVMAEANGLYQAFRGVPIRIELLRLLSAWLVVVPSLLALGFFTKTSEAYSRVATLLWFVGTPATLGAGRVGLRLAAREVRKRGRNSRVAAIAGATPIGRRLARRMREEPWLGLKVIGYFDDRHPGRLDARALAAAPVQGTLDTLVEKARKGEIDLVYLALPMRAEPRIHEIVRRLADTTASVYMAADFDTFDLLHARWTSMGEVPVVSIHETPFYGVDGWLKRAEDIVLGTLILLVIALPMLAIAIAVKLTSAGPVFFRQRRYGLNGEVIDVLKFRSMTVAEDGDEVRQATKDDRRVTPLGAFLRRTSLDELPQFLHVLTGEMSIVGPRPHAVAHNELYRKKIKGYMLRHKVKPGITGWAQVNGWRGETDTLEKMEKRVEHDLEYIRSWDLLWDLQIIARTVFSRKARRNAY
jgi:putative colanic acid biosynthesis UDP-glucose lipid carrier transferase